MLSHGRWALALSMMAFGKMVAESENKAGLSEALNIIFQGWGALVLLGGVVYAAVLFWRLLLIVWS